MKEELSVEEWAQPEDPKEEPWELPADRAEDPEEEDFGINFGPDPEVKKIESLEDPRFNDFLLWEQASRDTIDFKKIYVDITGDLNAGQALSQLIFWYLPDKEGKSKLRVFKQGRPCVVKARHEWWDETRQSPKQIDRSLKIIQEKRIIYIEIHRFKNFPTMHIFLNKKILIDLINEELKNPTKNPFLPKDKKPVIPQRVKTGYSPKGKNVVIPQRVKTLTETTTETTTENNNNNKDEIEKENAVVVLDFQSLKNGPINFTHSEVQKLCQKTGKSKEYIINRLELAFKTMESFPPRNNPKGWLISSMVDEYDLEVPESSGEVRPNENRQSREHNNQEHRETTASILAMRKESLEDPGAQRFFKLTDKLKNKPTSETIEKEKPVKLREVQEKRKKAEQNKAKAPACR